MDINTLHVAHLGFTALCICWKFPLIKSQKLVYFQREMREYCRKKENEMLSGKTYFEVESLFHSGWENSGRSVISPMRALTIPPHSRCKSINWEEELPIGNIQQWTHSWTNAYGSQFFHTQKCHGEPVPTTTNKRGVIAMQWGLGLLYLKVTWNQKMQLKNCQIWSMSYIQIARLFHCQ